MSNTRPSFSKQAAASSGHLLVASDFPVNTKPVTALPNLRFIEELLGQAFESLVQLKRFPVDHIFYKRSSS